MRKRARIIYNPSSGREVIKKDLPDILAVYEDAGYETSAFQTTPEPLSAQKEAARCSEDGIDLIVAAGGDGTIHEVISGIAEKEYRPTVAIIPAGTTNDYARALRIPRHNLIEAAKLIHKQESLYMDIGKVITGEEEQHFVNIGAMGNLVSVTFDVTPQLKTIFGYLAYVVKGVELLPQVRSLPVEIDYEGGRFEGEATLVFIALSSTVGGFNNIVPDKVYGDGKFSMIIVKKATAFELVQLARKLLTDGTHLDSPLVIHKKTDYVDIKVTDDQQLKINLDGEYGGDAPVRFENLNHHVEVVVNMSSIKNEFHDLSEDEKLEMKSLFTSELSSLEEIEEKAIKNEQEA
ncbi:MAG TPA: diacylglycerol kinase [Atopostipes sp.]|nr:diacylglycerol kinase [Atopostipes sp.]